VIAVGFFAVSGTLGIALNYIGNADGGNIGKIVNGVIQEGDAAAQDSAENFSDDKAESGGHGPAQHGRAECRVSVIMIVVMRMTWVIVAVRMLAHPHHSTHSMDAPQPSFELIRQFDTPLPEWIDAPRGGCDHETSFPFCACWRD